MQHRSNRRTILGLMGSAAATAFGSIAIGWRRLLTDAVAAGPPAQNGPVVMPDGSVVFVEPDAGRVLRQPPVEEIVLGGTVVKVTGPASFVAASKRHSSDVTADASVANPVYPRNHVPREGDDFIGKGKWLGAVGNSTFQFEFVDYNIRRVRGALSTTGLLDAEANYTIRDFRPAASDRLWQLVVRPEHVEYLATYPTGPQEPGAQEPGPRQPTATALAFADGTGVDVIGYEARPNVMIVTWIEARP